jgi:hypothetical protein
MKLHVAVDVHIPMLQSPAEAINRAIGQAAA